MTDYYTSVTHTESAHNLSMITGYIVEQTIMYGEKLVKPLTRNRLDGANKYTEAIKLARGYCKIFHDNEVRKNRFSSWAVIRAVYADGCISEPF